VPAVVLPVTGADAAPGRGRRAIGRTLAFLILGLGFLGILLGDRRGALHDVIAGTVVVYMWDAQAARLRYLSRRSSPVHRCTNAGSSPVVIRFRGPDRPTRTANPEKEHCESVKARRNNDGASQKTNHRLNPVHNRSCLR
jgi:hypothetical protein